MGGKKQNSTSTKQPSQSKVVPKVAKKVDKQRKICVGWLHRSSKNSQFTQVRMKDGGSTRHLEYNDSEADSITVDFLIKQAIQGFFPEGKSKFGKVQDMDVELGNFAQEKVAEFKNTDGEKCTFKEHLKDRGLFASKFYVYLMTTLTEDVNTLENVVKQTNVVTSSEEVGQLLAKHHGKFARIFSFMRGLLQNISVA